MDSQTLIRPDGTALSYIKGPGDKRPGIVYLHGLWSDKTATKATYLAEVAAREGIPFLRFDAYGHGQSEGDPKQFTIGRAVHDALLVIDQLTNGPSIFIGSSMGGWVALRVMEERPERIAGVFGIAAAPDFTEGLESLSKAQRDEQGYPDALIDTGRQDFVLTEPWTFKGPVHLIQGREDASVDWRTVQKIADRLPTEQVSVTMIEDGDHRLNRPEDLTAQERALLEMHAKLRV
ncbi:MAG TPA: alpha/beta hydrolase [Alphaproteobacteria bacterium]